MAIYLDANAHLPLSQKAVNAFVDFNKSQAGHGHPMAISAPGRAAAAELERARADIAKHIGAEPNQIVITSTATQACEWGLEILKAQNFNKVYTTTIEHKSVATKSRQLFGNNDLLTNKDGIVSCSFKPHEENCAFVCMHVQNEIGTIQSVENIPVPFFSDMTQSLGKVSVNVSRIPNLKIGVFSAHKFGGPASIGILYLQDPKWWQEFGTGSRYFRDRPGTPDVGMVVATSVALDEAIRTLPGRYEQALKFRSVLENTLGNMGVEIIGANASRVPHTTLVKVGGKLAPYVMTQLESEGIFVGLGSACGSLTANSNPVMSAIGHGGHANDYMRISQWGEYGHREGLEVARALSKYCPKR